MMKYKTISSCIFAIVLGCCASCDKFLDKKSEMSVNVPDELKDLRLMLDDAQAINQSTPGLIELGADDYAVTYANLIRRNAFDQDIYLWTKNVDFQIADVSLQWVNTYKAISIAHIVLESLKRINAGMLSERNTLEGEALFVQGFAYFHLAQIYAPAYVPNAANEGLGLVFRPSSDFNEASYRISIAKSYQLILDLLTKSATLLPEAVEYKTRPAKQSAYALLARVYLSMESYSLALEYAEKALAYGDKLADLNTYKIDLNNPFPTFAEEIIYYAISNATALLGTNQSYIPTELYEQYTENDLRQSLFYALNAGGKPIFKGSYSGNLATMVFTGLAMDELYYIKAECEQRIGLNLKAMETINQLLKTRWKTGRYVPFASTDEEETLRFILAERRKGLIYRGLRWPDLRRLNRDARFSKSLARNFEDNELTASLPANDKRYVYPIPSVIIERTNVEQNER